MEEAIPMVLRRKETWDAPFQTFNDTMQQSEKRKVMKRR
jgi:hypothetical protein